jgi:hypothetical protein
MQMMAAMHKHKIMRSPIEGGSSSGGMEAPIEAEQEAEPEPAAAKARSHGLTFDFGGEVGMRMVGQVRPVVVDVVAAAADRAGTNGKRILDASAAIAKADAAISAGDYVTAVMQLREAFKYAKLVL